MKVAVLGGGRSSEHEISLASAASVREGLASSGHDVVAIEIGTDGVWRDADGEELGVRPGRGLLGADVAFPVLHGPWGEDGTVQGLIECLDLPYVGADVLSSAACMDKLVFKRLMAQGELPQVDHEGVLDDEWRADRDGVERRLARLGLPVFVKPARLGSSVGIAKVDRAAGLAGALDTAFEHDPRAIVEAMSHGLEIECSVLGNRDPSASEPGQIVLNTDWYDFEAKYTPGGMELVVPADISPRARDRVRKLAVDAFTLVGCSGMARADFFVEGDEVLVNELNTIPGFTPTSVFGKLWAASGVTYETLLDRLVDLAVDRYRAERGYRF